MGEIVILAASRRRSIVGSLKMGLCIVVGIRLALTMRLVPTGHLAALRRLSLRDGFTKWLQSPLLRLLPRLMLR